MNFCDWIDEDDKSYSVLDVEIIPSALDKCDFGYTKEAWPSTERACVAKTYKQKTLA